ncbi:MAG: dienelactone hydrolase family protein [Microthrixaceae bacterium]
MRITLSTGTPAEVARPSNAEPTRGLVLLPDIGGLRPLFDDHARRLADELGWVVVAPEPWPGREQLELAERLESVKTLRDDDKRADLLAAAELTGCEAVGVMGFCMGGMYAMKAASTGRFDAAVSFYGMIRVPEAWRAPHQEDAINSVAAEGACPVLAICGTEDPWLPAEEVDELEAVASVVRYPGADHGFAHAPDRPSYRPDDAADAWARALSFLSSGGATQGAPSTPGST